MRNIYKISSILLLSLVLIACDDDETVQSAPRAGVDQSNEGRSLPRVGPEDRKQMRSIVRNAQINCSESASCPSYFGLLLSFDLADPNIRKPSVSDAEVCSFALIDDSTIMAPARCVGSEMWIKFANKSDSSRRNQFKLGEVLYYDRDYSKFDGKQYAIIGIKKSTNRTPVLIDSESARSGARLTAYTLNTKFKNSKIKAKVEKYRCQNLEATLRHPNRGRYSRSISFNCNMPANQTNGLIVNSYDEAVGLIDSSSEVQTVIDNTPLWREFAKQRYSHYFNAVNFSCLENYGPLRHKRHRNCAGLDQRQKRDPKRLIHRQIRREVRKLEDRALSDRFYKHKLFRFGQVVSLDQGLDTALNWKSDFIPNKISFAIMPICLNTTADYRNDRIRWRTSSRQTRKVYPNEGYNIPVYNMYFSLDEYGQLKTSIEMNGMRSFLFIIDEPRYSRDNSYSMHLSIFNYDSFGRAIGGPILSEHLQLCSEIDLGEKLHRPRSRGTNRIRNFN